MAAWEKMPFVEIALMYHCALTQFSLLAFYVQRQLCDRANGISMMTPSQRLSSISVELCGALCLLLSFDSAIIRLRDDTSYTGKGSRQPLSDFQYLFAHELMKGNALEALSIFLLSQAKSDAIFLLI